MNRYDLERANRPELVAYLEAHGFTCDDHEHTGDLRFAALLNYDAEGA